VSQEDVDFVLKAVEAFNARDLRYLRTALTDDFEFVSVLSAIDSEAATYRGTDAWRDYFEAMDRVWGDWHVERFGLHDAGEGRLAAVFELTGRGRASGIEARQRIGITYELRDGKIWRMRSYLTPDEALMAVGLEPLG
jgi:ketosteroid isomerase-like protein